MEEIKTRLVKAYAELAKLKCNRTTRFDEACQINDLTFTQIEYLKIIDQVDYLTISDLAEKTQNSKPTVTEMVKKFIALDCLYKQPCHEDGRKQYLFLSDRGKKIARMETYVIDDVINHLISNLTNDEIETLIKLLHKGTLTV